MIKEFPEEENSILEYYKMVYLFNKEINSFLAASAGSTGEASSLKKMIMKIGFPKKYPTLAKYAVRSTQDVLDEFFKSRELQLALSAH